MKRLVVWVLLAGCGGDDGGGSGFIEIDNLGLELAITVGSAGETCTLM